MQHDRVEGAMTWWLVVVSIGSYCYIVRTKLLDDVRRGQ